MPRLPGKYARATSKKKMNWRLIGALLFLVIGAALVAYGARAAYTLEVVRKDWANEYLSHDEEYAAALKNDDECARACPRIDCYHGYDERKRMKYVRIDERMEWTSYELYTWNERERLATCYEKNGRLHHILDCHCKHDTAYVIASKTAARHQVILALNVVGPSIVGAMIAACAIACLVATETPARKEE